LSLAHELKTTSPGCRIVYIGHKGDKFDTLSESYHDFDEIGFVNGGKFRRYHGESIVSHFLDFKTIFLNLRDFFKVIGSIFTALKILRVVKPDVVFSKGSFIAVPVGIAARIRNIPIVTHDSDVIPGLANKIVGRWATMHATGMPAELYSYPKEKTIYTGIPVDAKIKHVDKNIQKSFKEELGIDPANMVLLVAGASLGARDINDKLIQIAPQLLKDNPFLKIIHIAGQKNLDEVKQAYSNSLKDGLDKRIILLDFVADFYKYTGAADLIISRAGATSIAEFAVAAKACILIPSPFLAGGHQVKNAQELKKMDAVELIENDDPAQKLLSLTNLLLKDPSRRQTLAENLTKTAKTDASKEIAAILLGIANKSKQ
jgi:UDP-N-acetylglucosamine--N-acetylmuramyl-(pentapeptide) pyrophosphoryl-undecaprenol N-acetylglucosamine transferase